jgi:hypothetical protein
LAVNSAYKITGMLDSYHARPFLTMRLAGETARRPSANRPCLRGCGIRWEVMWRRSWRPELALLAA